MSDADDATFADIDRASVELVARYKGGRTPSRQFGTSVEVLEPRHLIRLRAIGAATVAVEVFHHHNIGPRVSIHASETIRDYTSPSDLAQRAAELYERTRA